MQRLFDSQLLSVKKKTIVKGIWEALQNRHVDKGLTNKLFLTRNFFTLQMNPTNTMEQHLNKLQTMAKELDAIGATIPLEVKVVVLLMSLFESYEFLVTSLESLKSINPKKLTWEIVATSLMNEELMRKEKFGSSKLSTKIVVILIQKRLESKVNRDKSREICNYYKEVGHWTRECKKKKTILRREESKII